MTLSLATINAHESTINNATTTQDKIAAVADYYQYLIDENVDYGIIAKNVVQDTGDFGTFANDVLAAAGHASIADTLKIELALEDIALRKNSLQSSGDEY